MRHPVLAAALAATLILPLAPALAADAARSLDLATPTATAKQDLARHEVFARALEAELNDGRAARFNAAFDQDSFLERVLAGLPESRELREVRDGMQQGLARVGQSLLQRMNPDYAFKYLRSRSRNGNVALLFRIDLGDEGLNYMELETVQQGEEMRIVDWYDHASAQTYSDAVRQALLVILPLDRNALERMLGVKSADDATVKQFLELSNLQRDRRFDEWLERYEDLPKKVRESRTMVLLRVFNANSSGNEEAYRQALDAAAHQFGDQPEMALLLVDHYIYGGDWDRAHQALDDLNRYTGGDAAIDGMRANIYLLAEDDANALRWAQRAIDGDADYEEAYWTRLQANVNQGYFDAATDDLRVLVARFEYEFDVEQLASLEGYQAFGRSAPFRRWAEGQ
ncbi:MAG TPA: hypothetical protein ENN42_06710 [Thioalkalivibrio sp.]|nr:hypothetical protein [Thioalkalivibrio sp.]